MKYKIYTFDSTWSLFVKKDFKSLEEVKEYIGKLYFLRRVLPQLLIAKYEGNYNAKIIYIINNKIDCENISN